MEKVILQEGDTFTSAHANALVNEITNVIESTEITPAQGEQLLTAIEKIAENHATPLVDGLNSADTSKALSAKQGKVLKGLIDNINTLLTSNDVSLDSLQELVNYIKANRTTLNALSINSIAGLQSALEGKVDNNQVLTNVPANAQFTDTVYQHPAQHNISDVSGLQDALDNAGGSGGSSPLDGHVFVTNFSTAASSKTVNIMRVAAHYWGPGIFKVEVYQTYFDGRSHDYSMVLARIMTFAKYGASTNILTKIDGNKKPHWSGITTPSGATSGYADLKLSLSYYQGYTVVVTVFGSNQVDTLEEVHSGNKFYMYPEDVR